jgi:hypothetical protein
VARPAAPGARLDHEQSGGPSACVKLWPVRGRKLRRGFGWRGWYLLLGVPVSVFIYIQLTADSERYGPYADIMLGPARMVRPALIASLTIILAIAVSWGRYKRSMRTKHYQEIVDPLVASREEYCLILRPFGSDGEIVIPHSAPGASTIEQVIARAVRRSLGLKTYAIVDQDRRLAPPGPIYLRAPHDKWQHAVQTLIRRAHSVVLILSPGQDIRSSFEWEIEELTRHELQSRVVIVLPPDRLYPNDYPQAFQYACVLVEALQGFAGSVAGVDPLRVLDFERKLPGRTHVLKYCRSSAVVEPELFFWDFDIYQKSIPRVLRWVRWGQWMQFYKRALVEAFGTTERELSKLGFAARYPYWPARS